MREVLTTMQMTRVDQLAIDSGITGAELMENAGASVAAHITANWDRCRVIVLCGPGNNGGDGYVIARHLKDANWDVHVFAYGNPNELRGDAALMFEKSSLDVGGFDDLALNLETCDLVVDAVFGAGFYGILPIVLQSVFHEIELAKIPVVAVDVPSGVNGDNGEVSVGTPSAVLSITFFRKKIGHLVFPGRAYCGKLIVTDIGIPRFVLSNFEILNFQNDPKLWAPLFPSPKTTGHKYDRGHVVICGGGISGTGAARIASKNALRIGAGAVTLLSPPSALATYAHALEAVMLKAIDNVENFQQFITSKRIGAILIGPANGVNERTKCLTLAALKSDANVVLDADAITVFMDDPDCLFDAIGSKQKGRVVITPHEAEFTRLFKFEGSALERCKQAAILSHATIVLKGATTIIATPDGRVILNTNSSPWLGTAGSGDALAGLIVGLISGYEDPLLATAAAVWIHGEVGRLFGAGLIAEDIESHLPGVMTDLIDP